MGVVGVRGAPRLKRPLELSPETDVARDGRRGGVATDDVDRARLETGRVREIGN